MNIVLVLEVSRYRQQLVVNVAENSGLFHSCTLQTLTFYTGPMFYMPQFLSFMWTLVVQPQQLS